MSPQDDPAGNGPLTPEERALAQRLARLGGQAEPSPALDARILAAAHAAAEGSSVHAAPETDATVFPPPMRRRSDQRPTRRPARWPAVFGFAASLALACGIAWQLRPVPPAPASMEQAAAEEPLADYAPPPPAPPSVRMLPPKPLNVPAPPPPPAAERRAPRRAVIRDATPADAEHKPQAFEPTFDVDFLDEAVPMPAQAPPPAAEAAAASAAAAAPASAAGAAPALQRAAPTVPPAAPAAAKSSANAMREADAAVREAREARRRQEPAFAEPDEEVVPPATADSPEVRDAWLERIRELLRDGDIDAARESLRAFRTRYPAHVLPEDLRPLEE